MRDDDAGRDLVALAQEATSLLQRLIQHNTVNPPGNERVARGLIRSDL